ncbi:MAG: hypothetical protein NC311_19570 [Muribaculaceae bacterium]|nr:hypothetical protein [Muribaculaceae bacterium]
MRRGYKSAEVNRNACTQTGEAAAHDCDVFAERRVEKGGNKSTSARQRDSTLITYHLCRAPQL